MNSSLYFTLFFPPASPNSPHPPSSHCSPSLFSYSRPLFWLTDQFSNELTAFNSFFLHHHMHYLSVVFHLKQMVCRLCNTFIHVSVSTLEVLCTCWGWIQRSLSLSFSQGNHTDPLCRGGDGKFLPGAWQNPDIFIPTSHKPFHSVSMRKWFVFEG